MAITPLPAVPLRSDAPATFVTKADAFLSALNLFATEVDAVGVALTLGATNATSTTSLLIGLGSKSLTVQTGKSYVVGMTVKIASTAVGSTWMLGDITSYTTGTGALVVTVTSISGSGTLAAWTISQSAPGGAQVGANADITSLSGLTTPLSVAQGGTGVSSSSAGIIIAFSGNTAPAGYLACPTAATTISRTTYAELFNAIGTLWGAGDGSTTFGMPYFPAGYTTIAGTPGTTSVGAVIAHTHTVPTNVVTGSGTGGGGIFVSGADSVATSSTGGAANLAAGSNIKFCIKY